MDHLQKGTGLDWLGRSLRGSLLTVIEEGWGLAAHAFGLPALDGTGRRLDPAVSNQTYCMW